MGVRRERPSDTERNNQCLTPTLAATAPRSRRETTPLTTREIVRGWVAFVLMIVPTVLGFYALANIYG